MSNRYIAEKNMKKHLSAFIALALLSTHCLAQSTTNPKGISVRPVTIDVSTAPGTTESKRVLITNGLDEKKQFIVYVTDWLRDTTGGHIYSEPSENPRSCATWIDTDKSFFELEPGQTEELYLKISAPGDSNLKSQMRWCMLFIETTQEKKVKDTTGVTTTIASRFRVGVHIYLTPEGMKYKELKLLQFTNTNNQLNKYRMICQNTGQTQLHCTAYLELSSLTDGSRIKLPVIEFPIFPDQIRYLDFTIPESTPKGKYTLTGIIDAGEEVPLEATQVLIEL